MNRYQIRKKAIFFTLLLCLLELTSVKAQQTAITSGADASGSGGSVAYSVGQIVTLTNIGTNGSVASGVQQPYEISVTIGKEETGILLNLSAFPNPTTERLTLQIENYKNEKMEYQLFDINGKRLESEKINKNCTNILMSKYLPATYFLTVINNNKEIKTFKLIKK
ncbi:MAG: hypothetical protein A2033_01525 [Bacteroidetes bacterium GWA2_31_9]|nr:MAG: hypothetical protein A2033_01525 [Bacteroidetes bacterium GWA2_31_9]